MRYIVPMRSVWRFLAVAALVAGILLGCGDNQDDPIVGRILDDRIELERTSGPAIVWIELDNAGSRPCGLIVASTAFEGDAGFDPYRLPVRDGRVRTTLDETGEPSPDEIHSAGLYAEIDGQPVEPDPGLPGGVVVEPGTRVKIQLALSVGSRSPDGREWILICDDPGDYEAGRFGVLEIVS